VTTPDRRRQRSSSHILASRSPPARQWQWMSPDLQEAVQVVSHVLPFRTNEYVMEQLIDWNRIPDDPIYRLTFPHRDMLPAASTSSCATWCYIRKDDAAIAKLVHEIRMRMNPHPAGQMTHNVPRVNDAPLKGLQHKYKETVLFFPSAGQTCHAYCTFCFRWPQFVGMDDMKFDARECTELVAYLARPPGRDRRPDHRRRPDDHEYALADRIHRAAAGAGAGAYPEHPHRHQVGGLLAAALRVRQGQRRPAAPVREGGQGRQEPGHHGPLQPCGRAAQPDRPAGRQAHRRHRRHAAHAGPADPPHQRRSAQLGRAVDHRRAPGRDPVLHVRRARHRPARVLLAAAGARPRDLPAAYRWSRACRAPCADRR
jgi:hypothetical protein